jgi:hypothetical protein
MSTGRLLLILIFAIPICGIVFSSLEKIARYKAKGAEGGGSETDELSARVQALEGEMDGVRQQQAETLERLDFAERLLARSELGKVAEPGAGS